MGPNPASGGINSGSSENIKALYEASPSRGRTERPISGQKTAKTAKQGAVKAPPSSHMRTAKVPSNMSKSSGPNSKLGATSGSQRPRRDNTEMARNEGKGPFL